ncbi:uncharacterized protein LOC134586035 [Pelobates fuscus]|uniref:uncharacterized protein LOC134586035 n=1 Tax=Pelobates fuscus TaxID=191477 RepID=UPI002FE4D0F4
MANRSGISSIELLVFPGLPEKYEILVSVAMFLIFNISLITNGTVILLIFLQRNLHHPMYEFIGNLALSDLLFDTITLPKIVAKYWNGDGSMSVPGCITQLFFVHYLGTLDSFLIMVMAFDRYVAICNPLRYSSIVTNKFAAILCSLVWILAATSPSHSTIRSAQFNYCGNKIKSGFCSTVSVFSLACTDYSTALQISTSLGVSVLLGPLLFIILSYIIIIKAIHSSARTQSWQKTFQTCTTHLSVICMYYIPRVTLYLTNLFRVSINADINVLILFLYTYFPHLANPIIYCLGTGEIKNTLQSLLKPKASFQINDKENTVQKKKIKIKTHKQRDPKGKHHPFIMQERLELVDWCLPRETGMSRDYRNQLETYYGTHGQQSNHHKDQDKAGRRSIFFENPMANHSSVFLFELVGFPGLPEKYEMLASVAMFLVYCISLMANGTVILLTVSQQNLQQPMYKYIGNLGLSDLFFDTITMPQIIVKYWYGVGSISVTGCITQMYFVHFFGSLDSFLLLLMAFDRYVAICKPLRYNSIVTNELTLILCSLTWILTGLTPIYHAFKGATFNYCGNNKISSCFCSIVYLFNLACADLTSVLQISTAIAMSVLLGPLSFIVLSYIVIIKTIHSSSRSESWQKVFHTCTTHLLVIGLYYIPRVTLYFSIMFRVVINADINVLILCLYTYIPHLANPVIYCLRTEEIKKTLQGVFKVKVSPQVKATL